jgi:hypothetical protein
MQQNIARFLAIISGPGNASVRQDSLHRLDTVDQSGILHFEAQASSQGRTSAIYLRGPKPSTKAHW